MTALTLAALLIAPAHAYDLTGWAWGPDTWPLSWYAELDPTDAALSISQQQAAVEAAFEAWDAAAPCVDLSAIYQGQVDRDESYDLFDGDTVFAFGDPEGVLDSSTEVTNWFRIEEGELGSLVHDDETLVIMGTTEADVTFNSGIAWTTVAAGSCEDQVIAEVMALQRVGFHLGLSYSCTLDNEASADCTDDEQAAVMFWDADMCDAALATPQADDLRGLLALYSPIGTSAGGDTVIVAAGEERCLTRSALTGGDESVSWDLGDGTTIDGVEACHSWTDPGEYAIGVSHADCSNDAWGEVLACSAPALPAGSEHAFDMTVNDDVIGLRLLDTTNDDRCVSSVDWEIIQTGVVVDRGSGVLEEFVLPPGTWTVAVTVTGVAGVLEDEQQVTIGGEDGTDDTGPADGDPQDGSKGGCGCAGAAAPAGLVALWPGLLIALRRRQTRA